MFKDKKTGQLTIIPIAHTVLFHGHESTVKINKELGDQVNQRIIRDGMYAIGLTLSDRKSEDYTEDSFYSYGVLMKIQDIKYLKNNYQLHVDIVDRVEIKDIIQDQDVYMAQYELASDIDDLDEASKKDVLDQVKKLIHETSQFFKGSGPFVEFIDMQNDLPTVMASLIQYLNITVQRKQEFFEIRSLKERSLHFIDLLMEQKAALELQMEIAEKLNEKQNKHYRETMLREQMKAIQEELSEGEEGESEKSYEEKIEAADMPEEVKKAANRELQKFNRQANGAEKNVIQNYLDLLVDLPWKQSEVHDIDIAHARHTLNQRHYGLDKVKDRIIQHLTVMKLKKNKQGSILLLVGPPGTGKTSLGKSIAEALDREYVRASLGGMRDEAEIRGHRRTYVGALPGRIIQGMKKAGTRNPVFILDEIDKLMTSYSGDPASALLEVLDPEQNNSFQDHYLEVPYDLSDVFFIATANSLKGIPGPLLDRLEVIQVSGYTGNEKWHIADRHLVPEVLEDHGLTKDQLLFDDETLKNIIDNYTREAGVRTLKRQLASVTRVAAEKIVTEEVETPFTVEPDMLEDMLGRQVARHDKAQAHNPAGVVTGLAWTPVGGEILFIEGAYMPGKGGLLLTGQLGDVMKESARISLSLVRSRLAHLTSQFEFDKNDLHIHVPSGAVPKDGPSAGVTMFTAIASLVTGVKVDPKLAMTGEISLRGAVLPVGGIKEKVLAAHRAGIKKVILPQDNEVDLKDVPEDVKAEMDFVFASRVEDVLFHALEIELAEGLVASEDGDTSASSSIH